jgi:pimeloyl-ACP methyl ester carboxylesterase
MIPLRARLIAVLLAAPFAAAMSADAAETAVTLDNGVAATLNQPENANGAAVLMLHGFGSSKDEVGNMYKSEAAALAAKGIASLRIDFRGFGKSDGDTGATTVDLQVEDAKAALAYLKQVKGVDPARVGVLGFSLGGAIAVLTAASDPSLKSLATWSGVGDLHKDFQSLGQKAWDTAAKEGIVGLDLGWRTIVLKKSFFDSLDAHPLEPAIGGWAGAYFTVAGSEDFSAAYPDRFIGLAKGAVKEKWIVPGGDHIYKVLTEDQTMANEVIAKTADWFARTL